MTNTELTPFKSCPIPFQYGTTHFDSIFFRKSDLRVGSQLKCIGRNAQPYSWFVEEIITQIKAPRRFHPYTTHSVSLTSPRTLSDKIKLKCYVTNGTKTLTFGYLSYSAIWQLQG